MRKRKGRSKQAGMQTVCLYKRFIVAGSMELIWCSSVDEEICRYNSPTFRISCAKKKGHRSVACLLNKVQIRITECATMNQTVFEIVPSILW